MPLPINTVIAIPQRVRNIYKIVSIDNARSAYVIQHCQNRAGYPLCSNERRYIVRFNQEGIRVISEGDPTIESPTATYSGHRRMSIDALASSFVWPTCIADCYRMIESRLSPESLTCDGELPLAEIQRRKASLLNLKAALDRFVGSEVELRH